MLSVSVKHYTGVKQYTQAVCNTGSVLLVKLMHEKRRESLLTREAARAQMVWSAWLSTLGHAPTDLLDQAGADVAQAVSHAVSAPASSPFGSPAFAHAAAAVGAAASPLMERAGEAVQGMAAMAERLPSSLLEKAMSKSLDVLSPLHAHERSPSQLLDDLLAAKPSGALDGLLERSGTLRLPMVLEC